MGAPPLNVGPEVVC